MEKNMETNINTKSYPFIKNAVLLCLLLFGIQIITGFVFGLFFGLFEISSDSAIYGISMILVSLLSFGLVIFIGFKKTNKKFNEVFKFKNVSLSVWVSVVIFMFGFVILSSEFDNLINYLLPMPEFLQDVFASMLINEYLIISIIMVGILPSFLEEMFFRGLSAFLSLCKAFFPIHW